MSVIRKIIDLVKYYRVNRNDETRREWLRSLGCKVGDGTRFIGRPALGSEPYLVEIGENCLISSNVTFHTHDGGIKVLNFAGYFDGQRMDKMARIRVGNNCFLGSGSRIMGGVKIGNNCIIGAASIVTKDVPDGSVVAGMPAKIICTIDDYYKKGVERGMFYPTPTMSPQEKKEFLIKNVPVLE